MLVQCQIPGLRLDDGSTVSLTPPKIRLFRRERRRTAHFTRVAKVTDAVNARGAVDVLHTFYRARFVGPMELRVRLTYPA